METHITRERLNDQLFLAQFENQTLDPVHFSHRGHLRLAWLYLRRYDLETAVARVCCGIKAYAESLGANSKFHLTMTDAFVRIIALRMKAMPEQDLDRFLEQNRDLVDNAPGVLLEYFSEAVLYSETARTRLVAPDRKAYQPGRGADGLGRCGRAGSDGRIL